MELSLHHKIYIDLKEQIENGIFKYGELIPSEADLQKKYTVSRAPVRQALARLENEFYIEKKQGKGTFVKYSLGKGPWYAIGGLGEDYKRDWDKQKSVTVSVEYVSVGECPDGKHLFPAQDRVVKIERLRYVNDVPIYYLNQFLPGHLDIEKIRAERNFLTIRELLYQLFNISVHHIYEEVAAVNGPEKITSALQVSPNKPLLEVRMSAFTAGMDTAYYDLDYVNSDYWKYKSRGNGLLAANKN